jgi:hypothetical protein
MLLVSEGERLCYIVAESFHKIENIPNEMGTTTQEISWQNVESATCFFLLLKCERRDLGHRKD